MRASQLNTLVLRRSDGLLLCEWRTSDHKLRQRYKFDTFKKITFSIYRKINDDSPKKCSIDSNDCSIHYLIDRLTLFVTFCEKSSEAEHQAAIFRYLAAASARFHAEYAPEHIAAFADAYACIEFEVKIGQISEIAQINSAHHQQQVHGGATANDAEALRGIDAELQGIRTIMVQNVEEILAKGSALAELEQKSVQISQMSEMFREKSRLGRSRRQRLAIIAALAFLVLIALLFVCYKLFR